MKNWPICRERALQHQLVRAIHLSRTNPDYQVKYPAESRANPDHKVLSHCHKEAEKRILHEHETILRLAAVPDVERPKRLNRLG